MKKEQSYQEAVSQLEAIISELEEPDVNMDSAKSKLNQAARLIAFCKKELMGYKEDFSAILRDENEESEG